MADHATRTTKVTVNEGPHDAQMRTLRVLTIRDYFIYLATSNKYVVAKTDGLFPLVLEELGFARDGVVMVGDSWDRDIVPTMAARIGCFGSMRKKLRGRCRRL
jgi:FMN phosphatase YigB (HAD superfamily)